MFVLRQNVLIQSVSKKLTLLNSLPNKKYETFSIHFHMYGWLRLSYIMTPKSLKIIYAWVSTGHFCKEYEN